MMMDQSSLARHIGTRLAILLVGVLALGIALGQLVPWVLKHLAVVWK